MSIFSGFSRRDFMSGLAVGGVGAVAGTLLRPEGSDAASNRASSPPLIRSVRDFGALAREGVDDSAAIQRAIDETASAGGGMLGFPPGVYRCDRSLSHRAGVSLLGAGVEASVVSSTAEACLVADPASPPGGVEIAHLTLQGAGAGYRSDVTQIRLTFRHCYLDGGGEGYGLDVTGTWIECALRDSVITQMARIAPAAGEVCNGNLVENCRINATGLRPEGGHVLILGGNGGRINGFTVLRTVCEVGGIWVPPRSPAMMLSFQDLWIGDPHAVGDSAILVQGGDNLWLSNIVAEGMRVEVAGSVSRVFAANIYCHSIDWNQAPSVFAWGVTTQADGALGSVNPATSMMEHEGVIYGQALHRRRPEES